MTHLTEPTLDIYAAVIENSSAISVANRQIYSHQQALSLIQTSMKGCDEFADSVGMLQTQLENKIAAQKAQLKELYSELFKLRQKCDHDFVTSVDGGFFRQVCSVCNETKSH